MYSSGRGDLPAEEFDRRLAELRVSGAAATAFRNAHKEYLARKAEDEFRAMIMKVSALAYIPNLSEAAVGDVRVADLGSLARSG